MGTISSGFWMQEISNIHVSLPIHHWEWSKAPGDDIPKNLSAVPPYLQQMQLHLQENNMIITYQPGKDMTLADGLSQLPSKRVKEAIKLDIKSTSCNSQQENWYRCTRLQMLINIMQTWSFEDGLTWDEILARICSPTGHTMMNSSLKMEFSTSVMR